MKNLVLILFALVFFSSCLKNESQPYTSNAEEILDGLDNEIDWFTIKPDSNSVIETNQVFDVFYETVRVRYQEGDGSTGYTSDADVVLYIDSVLFTYVGDTNALNVELEWTDLAELKVTLDDTVRSSAQVQMRIDYIYNVPMVPFIHGRKRSVIYPYTTR